MNRMAKMPDVLQPRSPSEYAVFKGEVHLWSSNTVAQGLDGIIVFIYPEMLLKDNFKRLLC